MLELHGQPPSPLPPRGACGVVLEWGRLWVPPASPLALATLPLAFTPAAVLSAGQL